MCYSEVYLPLLLKKNSRMFAIILQKSSFILISKKSPQSML